MVLQLSKSSVEILSTLLVHNKPLYINEIVRVTGLYPNSVQRALETLEKQKIVTSKRKGNKRFYFINKKNKYLDAIKLIVKKSKKSVKEKVIWMKFVNRDVSVAINDTIGKAWSSERYMKKFKLKPLVYLWYNSVTGGSYGVQQEIIQNGKEISKNIKKDSKYAKFIADSCIKDGQGLVGVAQKVPKTDLSILDSTKLYRILNELYEKYKVFMPYFAFPHSVEESVERELERLVPKKENREKLLEPTIVVSDEQRDELKLAQIVKEKGWTKENIRELARLTKNFCWIPMMNLKRKPFDVEHFRKIVNNLAQDVQSPKNRLKLLRDKEEERKSVLEKTLKNLKADAYLRDLVSTAQSYIRLRTFRTNTVAKFHFYHLSLLWEVASRVGLEKDDVFYLTYDEVLGILKADKITSVLRNEITKRKKGFANLTWKGKTEVISGVENIISTIEQHNIVSETPPVKRLIKGSGANRGSITGRVKIVKKLSELGKVGKGDVLVAKMTSPDYMTAINKASAIVTDEGGITSHAAIISREFDIPCIVGTKNSTQLLNDNDLVEVDAYEGVVRIVESVDRSKDTNKFIGKTIFKGKVKGKARVIIDASDFDKMQSGDIVIAAQTTPEYLSLLYRAKGFVVDEESITSHAVLYGKALEIPSIMGTSIAKNVIKDGEKIELDATNGVVRKI